MQPSKAQLAQLKDKEEQIKRNLTVSPKNKDHIDFTKLHSRSSYDQIQFAIWFICKNNTSFYGTQDDTEGNIITSSILQQDGRTSLWKIVPKPLAFFNGQEREN
jgi:hypothetical protein